VWGDWAAGVAVATAIAVGEGVGLSVGFASGTAVGEGVLVGSGVVGITTAVGRTSVGNGFPGSVVAVTVPVAVSVAKAGVLIMLPTADGSAVAEPPPKHDAAARRRRPDARTNLTVSRRGCIAHPGGSRGRYRAGDARSTLHLLDLCKQDTFAHTL